MMELKLISLLGLVAMVAIGLGNFRKTQTCFPWRAVLWGIGLQFAFALLILDTDFGKAVFDFTGRAIQKLIQFSNEGCKFVFGPLADGDLLGKQFGAANNLIFAILVVGTIIIVASLSSLFYHWGVLQKVVQAFAWVMRKAMRTSGSETLSAAANIFMGQTEAPLLIKPYIPRMTRSELLCMMTGGMATIAGGVAAVYAKLGMDAGHADMPGHLLTASVLSAPAALLISKVMLPETEKSETAGAATAAVPRTTTNSIDALCRGASDGMMLSINVIAMLIAFIAIVAMANFLFSYALGGARHTHGQTVANCFRLGQRAVRLAHGRAGARLPRRRPDPRRPHCAERIHRLPRPHQSGDPSRTTAVSSSPPMRCAALRILRASPFKSAASARSRRNAARHGPARLPRDDRRHPGQLHDGDDCGNFVVNRTGGMSSTSPQK